MGSTARLLIGEVVDKLLRSARSGARLHLDAEHVRALISSRAYPLLTEIQAEELADLWRDDPPPLKRTRTARASSDNSGSGTGKTVTTGKSAGTIRERVGPVASRLASAAASQAILQSRQRKRSERITPPIPDQQPPSSPPRLVSRS